MDPVGRLLTVFGVALVAYPIVGGIGSLADYHLPWATAYAPTFVLVGIFCFVVGIGLRTFRE